MGALIDNHWTQTCLMAIAVKNGSYVQMAALTDEITWGGEEQDLAMKTLLNGGNMKRHTPMTISEVSFKAYPAEISTFVQTFYGDTSDTSQPLAVTNTLTKKEIRLINLWVDNFTHVDASASVTTTAAMRAVKDGGTMTKCTPFWTDNEQGFDITIKFTPFTTAAVGNLKWESCTVASSLIAVPAYV